VSEYRLQYLHRSRKFIRAEPLDTMTDEEAIALAKQWRLSRRSELWKGARLVAEFSAHP